MISPSAKPHSFLFTFDRIKIYDPVYFFAFEIFVLDVSNFSLNISKYPSLFYSFPFPFIHPAALKIKFVPTQPSHDYAFQKWKTVRVFSKKLFNITFRIPANLFSFFSEELLTFIEESLCEVEENNENIDVG